MAQRNQKIVRSTRRTRSSGLDTRDWDTTLVDSQFDYAADTSFSDAARATYDKALVRDGMPAATLVRERFAARLIAFAG